MPQGIGRVGSLTIQSIGTVSDKVGFHTLAVIYPVGYSARRRFASIKGRGEFICEIVEQNDSPLFKITSSEDSSLAAVSTESPQGMQDRLLTFSRLLYKIDASSAE